MRAISLIVLVIAASGACWTVRADPPGQVRPDLAPSDSCRVEELSRSELRLGSSPLYIQPLVFEASPHGEVLLLGKYRAGAGSEDLIGVILAGDSVRPVQAPISPDRIDAPTATWNEQGYWDVTFLEPFEAGEGSQAIDSAGLWHGRLDSGEWLAFDRVELPFDVRIQPSLGTTAIPVGDTLLWAGVVYNAPDPRDVLVLRHAGGRWTGTLAPTRFAVDIALGHSRRHGLLLAAVHPDLSLSSDGNSLFLWRQQGNEWTQVVKLVASTDYSVNKPLFATRGEDGLSLAWLGEPEAVPDRLVFALSLGRDTLPAADPVPLLQGVEFNASPAAVNVPGGPLLWVSTHPGKSDPTAGWGAGVVGESEGTPVLLRAIEGPFRTRVDAAPLPDGQMLVTGGILRPGYVTNLLIRLRVRCDPSD